MAVLAVVVAFLSASQDIVIDAWRVESLSADQQAPGAAMIQSGYRIGMLAAGAGGLFIAAYAGWFAAYATMAALLGVGLLVFLFGPEPKVPAEIRHVAHRGGRRFFTRFSTAVIGPFRDFMQRPLWPVILIAIFGYKMGEAMAGVMSTPLYISLGFSLPEIADRLENIWILLDRDRGPDRRCGDDQIRHPPLTDLLRRFAVNRKFVFCSAGCRWASDRATLPYA